MPRIVRDRLPRKKTASCGVTDAELMELNAKVAIAGYANLGAWMRDVLFSVQVSSPPAQIDQDTNTQLRGIGGNLNQALKRINGGQGSGVDWDMIREASRAVILLRRKLVGQDPGEPLADRTAGIPGQVKEVLPANPQQSHKPGTWDV